MAQIITQYNKMSIIVLRLFSSTGLLGKGINLHQYRVDNKADFEHKMGERNYVILQREAGFDAWAVLLLLFVTAVLTVMVMKVIASNHKHKQTDKSDEIDDVKIITA